MPLQHATPSELAAMLAPFVNVRLGHKRDANGYVIPRTGFVDITYRGCCRIDADIRKVTGAGIVTAFDGFPTLIRWEDVREIAFRQSGRATVRFAVDAASVRRAA